MGAGVAGHGEPGTTSARMVPKLPDRPSRIFPQIDIFVEKLRRILCRRIRARRRRVAVIDELGQISRAAIGTRNAHGMTSVKIGLGTNALLIDQCTKCEAIQTKGSCGSMRSVLRNQMCEA